MAPGENKPLIGTTTFATPLHNEVPRNVTKAEIEAFGKVLNVPIDLDVSCTRDEMVTALMEHMAANNAQIHVRGDGTMECVPLPGPSVEPGDTPENPWTLPQDVAAYGEALDNIEAPYPRDFTLNGVQYRQETADDALAPIAIAFEEPDEPEHGDRDDWVPLVRINIPGMRGSGLRALEGMVRGTFNSKAGYSLIGGGGAWEIRGALTRSDECDAAAEAVLGTSYGFIEPRQFIKRVAPTVAEQEAARTAEHATTGE